MRRRLFQPGNYFEEKALLHVHAVYVFREFFGRSHDQFNGQRYVYFQWMPALNYVLYVYFQWMPALKYVLYVDFNECLHWNTGCMLISMNTCTEIRAVCWFQKSIHTHTCALAICMWTLLERHLADQRNP